MKTGLLALDIATTTGHAFLSRPGVAPVSGIFTVAPGNKDSAQYFLQFEQLITDLINLHNPHTIIFEAPFVGSMKNLNTARRLIGFAVIAELVALKLGVLRVLEVHNASVKKHFTGNGRADKQDMIFECQRRGWEPIDDNEADALAILCLGMSVLNGVEI